MCRLLCGDCEQAVCDDAAGTENCQIFIDNNDGTCFGNHNEEDLSKSCAKSCGLC